MSIDPKFVELTADVLRIFVKNNISEKKILMVYGIIVVVHFTIEFRSLGTYMDRHGNRTHD